MGARAPSGSPGGALGPHPIFSRAVIFMCILHGFQLSPMTNSVPVAIPGLATQHPYVISVSVGQSRLAGLRVLHISYQTGPAELSSKLLPLPCARKRVLLPATPWCLWSRLCYFQGDLYVGKGKSTSHSELTDGLGEKTVTMTVTGRA